ncbi:MULTISPECIES: globin domain-containing protein [Bacillus]|jgi:hemoglobin|uniref:Thiol management oxidoreductase n=4 Tax=Bacillus amyloliquefaciens group TaxID=1938374 RepID=A7Z3E5_BACVZ|nr:MULTISPECIES: thiol management oxidoreductase [Bacillus]AIU76595.1 thiol management oxidoreductase [Bacillus subtilis]MBL3612228.1 thiol management oxidoreductase [Bacillus sp. RHFS18]UXZ19009.1 thiol management oxidoreductase [Bacillus siamensis]COC30467.1 Truncated BHb [Streptococcus pneumoniae]ABS73521.1 thiol management oxidoreductase [Bacillus velezensis FZB42]
MGQSFNAPYEAIGEELLSQLVDTFYERVSSHPLLKPIFPSDLTETARKQKQFLTQYLGGPPLYTEEHGHPMLRARHLPFPITDERADAWLSCMSKAMDQVGLEGDIREFLYGRLELTARHMVNQSEAEDRSY